MKSCPCCHRTHDADALAELECIGVMTFASEPLALFNCECRSTFAIQLLPWPAESAETVSP